MKKESLKLGKYRHYSGKLYEVLGIAHHSETLEPMAVYKALYDTQEFGPNALWVRPLNMFLETIDIEGVNTRRFEFVE